MADLIFPKRSVLLVGGVPGSGKSWLLENLHVRCQPNVWVFSADEIRGLVQEKHGFDYNDYVPECIDEAREFFFEALQGAYELEDSIICDAAYLSKKSIEEMSWWASARNYNCHLALVKATWAECVEGTRSRARGVPLSQLVKYRNQFVSLEYQLQRGNLPDGLMSVGIYERECITGIKFGA